MKIYLRLLKFLKPHIPVFSLGVIFMVLASILGGISLSMIIPLMDKLLYNRQIVLGRNIPAPLQGIIDYLNALHPLQLLNLLIPTLLLLFLLKHTTVFLYSYLVSDTSQRVVRDIRNSLYEKILSLSLDYYDRSKTGTIVSRVTYDVSVVQDFICRGTMDFFFQLSQLIVFGGIAFFISPIYFLFILLVFPFIIMPMFRVGEKLRKIGTQVQERMADINSILVETISGIRLIKAFSMENTETDRFKRYNLGFYKNIKKSFKRAQIIGPATEFVAAATAILLLWFGVRSVIDGTISAGVFMLFIGAVLSLVKPARRLTEIYGIAQSSVAAANRIFEIIDEPLTVKEKQDAIPLNKISNGIVFENVEFSYNKTEKVLDNINLSVRIGEIVAITGESGTGKTTLVNLIPRFYDVSSGTIKIDGIDIRDIRISDLRAMIAMVGQEAIIFNGTILANISFGKPNAGNDEIFEAAKKANAHQFISCLPEGYDTVVGDRGYTLSGGERQRIAIARALLKNFNILILDEATSQLDSQSENFIQDALFNLIQGKTVFVIAHRLSTLQNADRIVVLENGKISAIGRHNQLIESSILYKRLCELQFKTVI